jgi:hypothetical protein
MVAEHTDQKTQTDQNNDQRASMQVERSNGDGNRTDYLLISSDGKNVSITVAKVFVAAVARRGLFWTRRLTGLLLLLLLACLALALGDPHLAHLILEGR